MFGIIIALLLSAAGLIYYFLISNYDHWRERGIMGPKPIPFAGNFPNFLSQKRHIVYDIDDIYREYKDKANFVGIYSNRVPQLLIISPEYIRRVLVNDFKHFHDNDIATMVDEKSDFIFANNPFSLTGEKWKETRAVMMPGLTFSRVKASFPVTIKNCAKLVGHIKDQMEKDPKDGLDAKDACVRFTSEVTTDSVLGLNADSFAEKPSTPILANIQALFHQTYSLIIYFILIGLFPILRRFYKINFIPKSIEIFFTQLVQTAIQMRRNQPQDRADFLNYMLQLQAKRNLSDSQVMVHTMTFFLDGFETRATVISHCLLLLGRNAEAQKKLRDEILSHFGRDKPLDCDKLIELPYLDACVHEAIRIFPPGFFSSKVCTEPIDFVNKDGSVLRVLEGDVINLPLFSVMTDEDYYPEPQSFRPERFLEDEDGLKKYRERGVYYGFGDGPRVCMGMRFALVQSKAALAEIIRNFDIQINAKTRKDNEFDKFYFISRLAFGLILSHCKQL